MRQVVNPGHWGCGWSLFPFLKAFRLMLATCCQMFIKSFVKSYFSLFVKSYTIRLMLATCCQMFIKSFAKSYFSLFFNFKSYTIRLILATCCQRTSTTPTADWKWQGEESASGLKSSFSLPQVSYDLSLSRCLRFPFLFVFVFASHFSSSLSLSQVSLSLCLCFRFLVLVVFVSGFSFSSPTSIPLVSPTSVSYKYPLIPLILL